MAGVAPWNWLSMAGVKVRGAGEAVRFDAVDVDVDADALVSDVVAAG